MSYVVRFIFLIFLLNSMWFSPSFGSNRVVEVALNTLPKRLIKSGRYDNGTNDLPKTLSKSVRNGNGTKDWTVISARLVEPEDYPFMVVVNNVGSNRLPAYCTGVYLASPSYVMTAAHCVHDGKRAATVDAVSIRYEARHTMIGPVVTVSNIYIHPNYDLENNEYDIALIRSAFAMTGNIIKPIRRFNALSVERNLRDMQTRKVGCTAVGYGLSSEEGDESQAKYLMAVPVNLITIEECQYMLKYTDLTPASGFMHTCAFTYGSDPCQGNGGQVLLCQSLSGALGIFSYGKLCGTKNHPAVFTRVDRGQSFLDTHVQAFRSAKSSSYCFQPHGWFFYGVLLFLGITNYETIKTKINCRLH